MRWPSTTLLNVRRVTFAGMSLRTVSVASTVPLPSGCVPMAVAPTFGRAPNGLPGISNLKTLLASAPSGNVRSCVPCRTDTVIVSPGRIVIVPFGAIGVRSSNIHCAAVGPWPDASRIVSFRRGVALNSASSSGVSRRTPDGDWLACFR